jgi:CarD family transcriptional regulator
MRLAVGDKIVYPGRGPCQVSEIVQKTAGGASAMCYKLALLDGSNGELFVPIDKFHELPVRALLDRSDIPKLLHHLKNRETTTTAVTKNMGTAKNWRERQLGDSVLFKSGSIYDLADRIESLTHLYGTKALAADERDTLYRARKLLVCEIAAVMNESKGAAEARVNSVLGYHREP